MASVSKLFPGQTDRMGTKNFDYFFFENQGSDDEKVRQKITMMASVSKHYPGPKNRIGKKYFWLPKFWPKNCPGVSRLFFFRDLLRQGNTKRKIYGSLKQTDYEKNSDWWWIYGGRIWQRWWYMVAVVVYGYGSVVVYGYGLVVVYGYGFRAVADKQWW